MAGHESDGEHFEENSTHDKRSAIGSIACLPHRFLSSNCFPNSGLPNCDIFFAANRLARHCVGDCGHNLATSKRPAGHGGAPDNCFTPDPDCPCSDYFALRWA